MMRPQRHQCMPIGAKIHNRDDGACQAKSTARSKCISGETVKRTYGGEVAAPEGITGVMTARKPKLGVDAVFSAGADPTPASNGACCA